METQKTALVTGANRGIGLEVARQLALRGWRVFAGCRSEQTAAECAQKFHAEKLGIEPLVLDVSSEASIAKAAAELSSRTEKLDALINNAGVYLDQQDRGIDANPKVVIETFQTNTLGPLLLTRAVLPLLKKAWQGQIINVSSGMGQLTDMNGGAAGYRLSKVSLNAVTRILAEELASSNIQVNSVCPGWVRTDMGGKEAPRTTAQGADTIVWLACGEADGESGSFFRDRKKIAW